MQNLKLTNKFFKAPPESKFIDYLMSTYYKKEEYSIDDIETYHIQLLFQKDFASEAIENTYASDQHIEQLEDGTVSVSFRSFELNEVFDWVWAQGDKVKVLNPPELVALMKKEIKKIGKYYSR
jgi:predicted DNA-binding transcriptional regulator YafY